MRSLFAAALVFGVLLCSAAAPAAVDMSSGLRYVIAKGTPDECSSKAQAALGAYLQSPSESAQGSGEWIARGPIGATGPSTASAVVSCYPVGGGYVVTFTCAVQTPGNPYAANDLCLDIAHKFSGKPVTALATPTPMPTGCTTANLVGTWVSNDKSGPTFKMDVNGDLTDADGISGNWALYGNTVTLTYYGNHTLTLSSDGKHMSGGGYNLTRKC
jgi:hypothetical protein